MKAGAPFSGQFFGVSPALLAIAATTLAAVAVSVYCLLSGVVILFQNLFYIPIIIACLYYSMKGFAFSVALSFVYLLLIVMLSGKPVVILEAAVRVLIFAVVAGTTVYLSMRRQRVERELVVHRDMLEVRIAERTAELVEANEQARTIIERGRRNEEALALNVQRMEALRKFSQMSGAPLQEITDFALEQAVLLTQSRIGYLAFLNADESVLTMHAWSKTAMAECAIQDKPIVYPVVNTGLWGEAVRRRKAVITNDYSAANPMKKGIPQGHVSLKRHMNVPVFDGSRIVIVAGVGNKDGEYDEGDVRQLTLLMEGMWGMLERRRTEEALRESEDRYRGLLSGSPDMLIFTDMDGRIRTVNGAWEKAHGQPEEAVVGKRAAEFAVPEDRPRGEEHIREIVEGRNTGPREYRCLGADGRMLDIEVNGEVIRNAAGQASGLLFIDRDISKRRERDRRDVLMREVLDCINKAEMSVDLIRSILSMIKAHSGFDAVGIRLRSGDDFPYFAQDGFSNEFLLKENSLAVRDRKGDVCRDENGNVLLECTCGLVIEGKADPANALFTRGGSAWTANSKPLLGIPIDQDPRLHPRNTCIHHGYSSIGIVPLRAGDTIVGILQLNDRREGRLDEDAVGFYEGLGNSIGIALTRKRIEEDLGRRTRQLETANQELESFSYSVAHDLRAPLRAIDGFSQAVQEDYAGKLDEDGKDSLRRIRAASQKMGALIDGLLKLSRITRAELRTGEVDLSAMASSVIDSLREQEPRREVEVSVDPGLRAQADPELMRAVMGNLLGNAWKFTRKVIPARIEVGVAQEGNEKAYFVRDNGAGFDQDHADKLFGAFQRLHSGEEFEGTGIGLATVRRIISRHGGRIWAESRPGAGATFHFTLQGGS